MRPAPVRRRAISAFVALAASILLFRFGATRSGFDVLLSLVAAVGGGALALHAVPGRARRLAIGLVALAVFGGGALALHAHLRGERRDEGPPPRPALHRAPTSRDGAPLARPFSFAVFGDTRGGVAVAQRVREAAALRRVDFSVGLGDLVGMARRHSFEIQRALWAATGRPTYFLPGNHDLDPFGETGHFERALGPVRWTFDVAGVRFVALDTSRGRLDEAQTSWAERLLAERADGTDGVRDVVVFSHHPVWPPTDRPDKPLPQDDPLTTRLQAALTAARALVFCGSYHAYDERTFGPVVQRVTGGGGSKLEGPGGHHLLVVTATDAGLRVEKVDVAGGKTPWLDALVTLRDESAWVSREMPLAFVGLWLLLAAGLGGLLAARPRADAGPQGTETPPLAPPR